MFLGQLTRDKNSMVFELFEFLVLFFGKTLTFDFESFKTFQFNVVTFNVFYNLSIVLCSLAIRLTTIGYPNVCICFTIGILT